jgi:hypothetical protein
MKQKIATGVLVAAAIPLVWLTVKLFLPAEPPKLAPTAPVTPPVAPSATATASDPPPPPKPVERLLRAYTSLFKTDARDERVHNITLGAKKLDGSVLEPGAEWSFNKVVGPRTEKEGFKNAPTLVMGEVIPGMGGGMCQVSSTVHAAALLAGLDIVKRQPHSRPSSYIERGFDATVNYPPHCWGNDPDPNTCFDLVLRNPYSFPIKIKALVHEPVKPTKVPKMALTVELRGEGPTAQVETVWTLYSTPPFKQRKRRAWRKGDWAEKKQTGQNGVNGALVLNFKWPDGRTEQRVHYSRYKPVDEVWWVGDDWDPDKNPWE